MAYPPLTEMIESLIAQDSSRKDVIFQLVDNVFPLDEFWTD